MVESAIGRPYSGYHRSISRKAAALAESIIQNHGFVDGNKRTAVIMMHTLLTKAISSHRVRQAKICRMPLRTLS
jgi:death-on-curing protein